MLDRLEAEAALVAQPAPVDRVDVDALVPQHAVTRRLHRDPATDRARGAGRLLLLEVPRSGLEPVRLRGERADRADLHGVAGEVRRERLVRKREHLCLVAPTREADQRVAGDLAREPGAPIAQDAALTVEEDEVADRDRLLEVALLLDEPALPRPVRHRLVLERALAALVAHGAVERVVDQQELEDAVLRLLHQRRCGVDDHAFRGVEHARDLQGRASRTLDLDEAHATHADRGHAWVVAEARDVDAVALGRGDHELAGLGRDRLTVDGERDVRQPLPPPPGGTGRSRRGSDARPRRSARSPTGRAGRSSSASAATRGQG